MLMMWLLVLMMLMRASVMLMRSACHSMRQQTVLVKVGGVHGGKDGGRRGDVENRTLR